MTLMRFNPMFADLVPPVDIVENDHNLTVKAELPGVNANDVEVTIENNVLILKGERRGENEVKKENYLRMEREYGRFARSFALPEFMDAENVKADFKDGLLTLVIPKKEHARTRSIEIKVA